MAKRVVTFLTLVLFLWSVPTAIATPITITYTFTGQPGDQPSEPADAQPLNGTASDITRGSGIIANAGMNSINSRAWSTSATLVFADNDYYEWTITPDAGYALDLTSIQWTFRSSETGPDVFQLLGSTDGFATAIPQTAIGVAGDSTDNFRTNPISVNGAVNLTSAFTFRLYGYSAESAVGTFRLGVDASSAGSTLPANLVITGDLRSVPEPTSLVLLGTGLAAAGIRRYRRKQ